MITPKFKLDQNEEYLFVNIRAPYANLNDVDLFVEDNDLRFYCKPYYLRLNLPANIIENNESGTYDFEEKQFKFKFQKATKGEQFNGLDLLTKLLTPNLTAKKSGPLIEEIDSQNNQEGEEDDEDEDEDENGDQWYLEQSENKDDEQDIKLVDSDIKYGFAQTKSNVFSKLSSEYSLIIDLPDPDNISAEKRTELRVENEKEKFDDDHYLADYFDDSGMIEGSILKFEHFFENYDETLEYTDQEIDTLKNLPKKTFLLDKQEKFFAFCGLVDILYAYCYNTRINCGEKNVESGWTIAKLSSTLSWFDTFKSLEDCVVASFRRSLCMPLYRNWKLSKAVYLDLIKLMKRGPKLIIKVLLEIRETFLDTECRYILNDLYINDYCVWIQYVSEKKLANLVECLEKIKITKEMVKFDLECLELAGRLALDDQNKDSDASDADESDSDDDDDVDDTNKPPIEHKEEDTELTSGLDCLVFNETDKSKPKPKIIELN